MGGRSRSPPCFGKSDELQKIGLDAFTQKNGPYWGIPRNKNLSQPVIELQVPKTEMDEKGKRRWIRRGIS